MAAVASDIVADGSKNLRVLADGDRGIKEIDFKAISIDKTKYQLQGAPVNFLSGTPAGKIASLRDLAQIDPSIARQAMPGLGIPDLDKIRDLTNAPRNIVDKYVELILDKGEFIPPDPIMDLDTARQQATLHLQLAIIENSPEDRVELLRLWITSLDELQELAEQPPEGAMPPGAEEAPQEQLDPAAMDPAMLEQIAMMNPNQEPM